MEFYSTYYKKLATFGQIKEIDEKFEQLDTNNDGALNKDEMANIFTGQALTDEEKALFVQGIDTNSDNFITYHEFIPTYVEFDLDQDAQFSEDEFEFAQKKIEELKKQMEIDEQYDILNNFNSSKEEKETAFLNIEIFNHERKIIFAEQNITKKEILIGDKELKTQQIIDFIDNNTLLEFEEAQKKKEIHELNVEKNLLLLEKDISVKQRNVYQEELLGFQKLLQSGEETDPSEKERLQAEFAFHTQEVERWKSEVSISEKNLELRHKQVRIEAHQETIKKFFVPEFIKENARKELDLLNDQVQLLNQRIDLHSKVSTLSHTRARLVDLSYQFHVTQDPAIEDELNTLNEQQIIQQKDAQISSLKVELIDKQIQLKDVLPRSNQKPFDEAKAALESEIADIQSQIAALGG